MHTRLATLFAAGFLAASPLAVAPANAQAGVELGLLTCQSEGAVGFVLGSSQNFACTFAPSNRAAPDEAYVGTFDTVGIDIGATGPTTLRWLVLSAASDAAGPGVLTGRYTGATANASVGIGAGVNLLVGGFQRSVTLQPASVQAQEGLNAAIGISSFRLAAVAAVAPTPQAAGVPNVIVR